MPLHKTIKRLIILSDSRIYNNSLIHPTLAWYLSGLGQEFDSVHYVARPCNSVNPIAIHIQSDNVHLVENTQSAAQDQSSLQDIMRRLGPLVGKDSAILVFPDEWTLSLARILPQPGRLAVYIGKNRKEVRHLHETQVDKGPNWACELEESLKLLIARADILFYRGAGTCCWRLSEEQVAISSKPITIVRPPSIDAREFFPEDRVRLLFVGEMNSRKMPFRAISLFRQLRQIRPNIIISLTMLGNGPLYEDVQKGVERDQEITLLPAMNDPDSLCDIYSSADILIFTGKGPEGLPRVIDEALLHGVIVVSSPVGAIKEEFTEGKGVIVVSSDSDADYIASLCRIIDDTSYRESLIKAGKQRGVEVFSESVLEQHANFLKR